MITLPKPMSQRPTGMPQKRRKSGLRTAAGALQEQFLERIARLREDPTAILPHCPDGEPRTVRKLRRQLEALKAGKTPFAARIDRHLLGAVHRATPLADWEAVPRMLDAKVAGQRRFYVQRGQVQRVCTLAVQNFDQPRVLLLGYTSMAQRHGLHFFALADRVLCTGKAPQPPADWFAALAGDSGVVLAPSGPGWSCRHADRPRVRLSWLDGPWIEACPECGTRIGGLHRRLREAYLGPRARKPVEIEVRLPDGGVQALPREALARYRAGLMAEPELAATAVAAWRGSGAMRWALGDRTFASAEAFVQALPAEPWERPVLLRLVAGGHVGAQASVAAVLQERRAALGEALRAHLDDGPAFLATRAGMAERDIVRAAHAEAGRRAAMALLPRPAGLGPQGSWVDALARANLSEGKAGALAVLRRSVDAAPVPRSTRYAFLHAVGGALDLESRFTADEKAAAQPLMDAASAVLVARGEGYGPALAHFLHLSGAGEDEAG